MKTSSERRRVWLLSTAHLPHDPRIVGKIAPSLSKHYEVMVLLPRLKANGLISIPFFKKVWQRVLVSYPILLVNFWKIRPHIVHIFVAELLPLAFVFRWFGAKIIYEVQENLYKKIPTKAYNRSWWLERLFRFFDHKARKYFWLVFTEDAYLLSYSQLTMPHTVVHNFADSKWLTLPSPTPDLTRPTFFYAGVVSFERGFDTLVKAVALLKPHYPQIVVKLFGEKRFNEHQLQNLANYEGVKDNFQFFGYQPQAIAFTHAQEAVAGLALLKAVGDYPDSYPTKLFDYMALGLPVITSDLPLLRQVVQSSDCGFCVSATDAVALADAMRRCIENPVMLRKMGENGQKAVVEMYNWEKEAQKLQKFYEKIV
ncbi:MAG: glycosyltransferase [Runella sp.]